MTPRRKWGGTGGEPGESEGRAIKAGLSGKVAMRRKQKRANGKSRRIVLAQRNVAHQRHRMKGRGVAKLTPRKSTRDGSHWLSTKESGHHQGRMGKVLATQSPRALTIEAKKRRARWVSTKVEIKGMENDTPGKWCQHRPGER